MAIENDGNPGVIDERAPTNYLQKVFPSRLETILPLHETESRNTPDDVVSVHHVMRVSPIHLFHLFFRNQSQPGFQTSNSHLYFFPSATAEQGNTDYCGQ